MSSRADFDKIVDKHGKLLGVLNYNLMIPVEEKQLIKVDLKNNRTDSASDRYYKQLCIDEINWCRKNADIIINKANCYIGFAWRIQITKGKIDVLILNNWKKNVINIMETITSCSGFFLVDNIECR